MITTQVNKNDRRTELIILTEDGKKLIYELLKDVMKMNDIYREIVGQVELETTIKSLNKILNYHEELFK